MEEKLEWEVVVSCEHSYDRRCAKTLKTNYKPFQVCDVQVPIPKVLLLPGGDLPGELCEELLHRVSAGCPECDCVSLQGPTCQGL